MSDKQSDPLEGVVYGALIALVGFGLVTWAGSIEADPAPALLLGGIGFLASGIGVVIAGVCAATRWTR